MNMRNLFEIQMILTQGKRRWLRFWLMGSFLIAAGCTAPAQIESTATLQPATATVGAVIPTQMATATPPIAPSPTNATDSTPVITAETTAGPTTSVSPSPVPSIESYLDDRSDAVTVLRSLVSAINRQEYVRAYSYWEENAVGLPSYDQFVQGYAETMSVSLQTGPVYGGVAAGNAYFDVPVILIAQTTEGTTQTFVGCYTLHLGSPAAQGALPFRPMAIQSAQIGQVANDVDLQTRLAEQCLNENGEHNGQPLPAATPPAPDDVSAGRYLDDRSDGVQVIRSYFNAVNLHEYVRAYDYWENQAALPALDAFIAGYQDTGSIQLAAGSAVSDAGAGQLYSQIPVVLTAQTAAGDTQRFAGCYTLHLGNPAMQGTPPFRPWGIRSADVRQVADDSDVQQLLAQGCAGN